MNRHSTGCGEARALRLRYLFRPCEDGRDAAQSGPLLIMAQIEEPSLVAEER
jgi:hypothetical protein